MIYEPTDRQLDVLAFIARHLHERGYAPTWREIGVELGIRSLNGINDHLSALLRKGLLQPWNRDGKMKRALVLTPEGRRRAAGHRAGGDTFRWRSALWRRVDVKLSVMGSP